MADERDPLDNLKKTLKDFSDSQLTDYIRDMSISRLKGPSPVKRSKATGAPTGGRATTPKAKLDKILESMGEEERKEFLESLRGEQLSLLTPKP